MNQVLQALAYKKYPVELDIAYTGFRTINWGQISADFEFKFGDGKFCRVQSFLAEALSPKIAKMRKTDAGADTYVFKDVSSGVYEAFESLVSQVRHGMPLKVEESIFAGLVRVCYELENNEILSSLIKIATLDVERAMSLLAFGGPASRCQPLIEFIASHFCEISEECLGMIDLETAWMILSHESLMIADENSVYDFVRSRVLTDSSFACLFEFVNFEYLSPDRIIDFVPFAREYLLDHLNTAIWDRIGQRLVLSLPLKCSPRTLKTQSQGQTAQSDTGQKCVYECVYTGNHMYGIIAFLTRQCGGNVHDLGLVEVTLHNVHDLEFGAPLETNFYRSPPLKFLHSLLYVPFFSNWPSHVSRLETEDICMLTGSGSWICYDFKQFRVVLSSYSIRIADVPLRPEKSIKTWFIEVSSDATMWFLMDQRENIDCRGASVHNFPCNSDLLGGFRYVRLLQGGENDTGMDLLAISALEFFGTLLIEPS